MVCLLSQKGLTEGLLTRGPLKLALIMVKVATGGQTKTFIREVLRVGRKMGLEFGTNKIKYTQASLFKTSVMGME